MSVKDIFQSEGGSIVEEIRSFILSTGANATGKSYASLGYDATNRRLVVFGGQSFGLNKSGRGFIESGRGPGKPPPVRDIFDWAIARGIVSDTEEIPGIVWAIRNNIAQKGTSTVSSESPRDIYTTVITPMRVEKIIGKISTDFVPIVSSEIVKALSDGNNRR